MQALGLFSRRLNIPEGSGKAKGFGESVWSL